MCAKWFKIINDLLYTIICTKLLGLNCQNYNTLARLNSRIMCYWYFFCLIIRMKYYLSDEMRTYFSPYCKTGFYLSLKFPNNFFKLETFSSIKVVFLYWYRSLSSSIKKRKRSLSWYLLKRQRTFIWNKNNWMVIDALKKRCK
jgi:hypothetical protein